MILSRTLWSVVACASMAAGTAMADGYTPPAGCEQYLTVQHRGCLLTQHFICAQPEGSRMRVDFTEEGPVFESRIDDQAQWLSSRSLIEAGRTRETVFPTQDHASMDTLLSSGYDDFTFDQVYNGERILRLEGFDRLTGESVVIDGEELLRTEYGGRLTDPATGRVLDENSGAEYVSPRFRRFFAGVRTVYDEDGTPSVVDNSPAKFFHPGEDGFNATEPRYDCGMMLSLLTQSEARG